MLFEGYKRNLISDYRGAISNYQRALELDPDLASALTAIAAAKDYLGENASAASAINRAYQMRDRLTPPIRSQVENLYYDIVTGEIEKQCAVTSKYLMLFPDDSVAHNNFGRCLQLGGQQDRALAESA